MTTDSTFCLLLLPRYDRLVWGASPCQQSCHETRSKPTIKQRFVFFVHASYKVCSIQHTITHDTQNLHLQHKRHAIFTVSLGCCLETNPPPSRRLHGVCIVLEASTAPPPNDKWQGNDTQIVLVVLMHDARRLEVLTSSLPSPALSSCIPCTRASSDVYHKCQQSLRRTVGAIEVRPSCHTN